MKRIFAIILALAMLTIFVCGCQATAQSDVAGTTGPEVPSSQPADGTTESTDTQSKQFEYQINDTLAFPFQSNDEGTFMGIYSICSVSELTAVYDGTVPTDKQSLNEAFFDDHSLVVVSIVYKDYTFGMNPSTLIQDQNGVYHLALDGYSPEWNSPAYSYHQLVLVTDSPLDPDADIVLDYTDHVVTHDEFKKLFPKS